MKFTIRDIILLTLCVGLGVGWWVDHRQWRIQIEELYRESFRYRQESREIGTENLRQMVYDQREKHSKWRKEWTEMWAAKGHQVYLPPEEQSALYTPGMLALAPPKSEPQVWAEPKLDKNMLYTDADAVQLSEEHAVEGGYLVVPLSEAWPRKKVFERLGIDTARLADFRHRGANNDNTLVWQFSPNYDLVCITAENDAPGPLPPLDHQNRKICGVHFNKRLSEFELLPLRLPPSTENHP